MRTAKIAGYIALAVVVLWIVAFLTGGLFYDIPAREMGIVLLNKFLVHWIRFLIGTLLSACAVIAAWVWWEYRGFKHLENYSERCYEKEKELDQQITNYKTAQANAASQIAEKVADQVAVEAKRIQTETDYNNRETKRMLDAQRADIEAREAKATEREDAAYNAAQNVAQLRDIRSMYLAQIGRAVKALKEGNAGHALKILTKDKKTYRPRRSRKPQNTPRR